MGKKSRKHPGKCEHPRVLFQDVYCEVDLSKYGRENLDATFVWTCRQVGPAENGGKSFQVLLPPLAMLDSVV